MEKIDAFLTLVGEHRVVLVSVFGFLVAGGYYVSRLRVSGMRKLLKDHAEILDDLSGRMTELRLELDNVRVELSNARARAADAEASLRVNENEIKRLREEVKRLEGVEKELLKRLNTHNETLD